MSSNSECNLYLSLNSEKSGQMDHTVYQGNGKSVQGNWGQKLQCNNCRLQQLWHRYWEKTQKGKITKVKHFVLNVLYMSVFVSAQYQWLMVSPFTLHIYSYKFKKMEGNFQRTGGLQAGIDLVEVGNLILMIKVLHVSDFFLLWSYFFEQMNEWMECFHFGPSSSGWAQYFVPLWPAPLLSCEYYKQYTKILYWGENGLCSSCDEARLWSFPKNPKWYWSPLLIRVSRVQQILSNLIIF